MLGYFLCLSFVKFLPCMKMFSSVPLRAAQGEGMWIATGTRTEGKPHSAGVYARGSHPQPCPHGSTSYRHLSFPQETVGPHTLLLNSQSVAPMYRNVKGVVVLFWRLDFFSYWHPWYKRTLFPHKREAIAAYNDGDQKRESKSHLPTWKRLSFTCMTDNELEPSRLIQMTNLAALEFWWIPWPIAWASLKCEQMSHSLVGAPQWYQYSPSMALAGLLLKIDMVKITFWTVTSQLSSPSFRYYQRRQGPLRIQVISKTTSFWK